MPYDSRDLAQELEDQGSTVHLDKDGYGSPIYRIILPSGKLYRLSVRDLYDLKDQEKLNAAGIIEHVAKIKRQKLKF